MRSGGWPGREEARRARLAEIRVEERRAGTRRALLGVLVGLAGGVAGSRVLAPFLRRAPLGDRPEPAEPRTSARVEDADRRRALACAQGSLGDLERGAPLLLSVVELDGDDDPELWMGVCRLVDAACEDRLADAARLRRRLLHLAAIRTPPPAYAPWFARLRRR